MTAVPAMPECQISRWCFIKRLLRVSIFTAVISFVLWLGIITAMFYGLKIGGKAQFNLVDIQCSYFSLKCYSGLPADHTLTEGILFHIAARYNAIGCAYLFDEKHTFTNWSVHWRLLLPVQMCPKLPDLNPPLPQRYIH